MKTSRLSTRRFKLWYQIATIFLIILTIGIMIYFPPDSIPVVITVITLSTLISYMIATIFPYPHLRFAAPLFTGSFLSMSALIGFNVFNCILLLSFIIVITKLFSHTQKEEDKEHV